MTTITPTTDPTPPPCAEPDMWTGAVREVYADVGCVLLHRDPLKCPTVTVVAEQRRDGSLGCIDVLLDVAMGRSDAGMSAIQARELAALLITGADLVDQWAAKR